VLEELLESCESGAILARANYIYARMVLLRDGTRYKEMFTRMEPWLTKHHGHLAYFVGTFFQYAQEYIPEVLEMAKRETYANESHPQNFTIQMGFISLRDYCNDADLVSGRSNAGVKALHMAYKALNCKPTVLYGQALCAYVEGDYHGCVKMIVTEQGRGSIVIPKASECLLLMKCYCFWKLGDKRKAMRALKHLRRFHPDCAGLARAEKRVARMTNRSKATESGTWLKQCSNPFCLKKEETTLEFLACSRCRKVFYCSRQCQKKHWKTSHQLVCMEDL